MSYLSLAYEKYNKIPKYLIVSPNNKNYNNILVYNIIETKIYNNNRSNYYYILSFSFFVLIFSCLLLIIIIVTSNNNYKIFP